MNEEAIKQTAAKILFILVRGIDSRIGAYQLPDRIPATSGGRRFHIRRLAAKRMGVYNARYA